MPQLKIRRTQSNKDTDTTKMRRNENEKSNEKAAQREESNWVTEFCENYDKNIPLECEPKGNGAFNYEPRASDDGCCTEIVNRNNKFVNSVENLVNKTRSPPTSVDEEVRNVNGPLTSDKFNEARDFNEHTYENLTYEKEILLQKFFRSRNAIYENLCRGCGYGVFEAHGDLCYFCASIVNGVHGTSLSNSNSNSVSVSASASVAVSVTDLDLINAANNIYENICENCYTIYDTENCEHCELKSKENSKQQSVTSDGVKIKKVKSFNKRNEKRGLFQGFIGSLKRSSKSPKAASAPKLEIIHNVDGYEHVFRTQESFDLQRICELKRAQQTSSSEQHIYGRVKCGSPEVPPHSNSTQTLPLPTPKPTALTKAESCGDFVEKSSESEAPHKSGSSAKTAAAGKRPRISKPRFLRAITSAKQKNHNLRAAVDATANSSPQPPQQQSLYLADSVCNWMTSLRRELHNYHSSCDDACIPKSIPAKQQQHRTVGYAGANILRFLKTKLINVTNTSNIGDVTADSIIHLDKACKWSGDVSSIESLESGFSSNDLAVTLRSRQALLQVFEFDEQTPVACAQMVNEFVRGLLVKEQAAREMSRGAAESELEESQRAMEILERRDLSAKRQAQRVKRQGIYLKNHEISEMSNSSNDSKARDDVDDDDVDANKESTSTTPMDNEQNIVDTTDNIGIETNCSNKQNKQQNHQSDGENIFEAELESGIRSPVSRRRTGTASGASISGNDAHKRCGVYNLKVETDFVGDILNDLDTYLQHEESAITAAEANASNNATAAYRETATGSSDVDPLETTVVQPLSSQPYHNVNFVKLVEELHLGRSLHRIVIAYEQPLHAFLKAIHARYPRLYAKWPNNRLKKKYKRFHKYCIEKRFTKALPSASQKTKKPSDSASTANGEVGEIKQEILENVSTTMADDADDVDALSAKRNSVKIIVQQVQIQKDEESAKEMVTTTPATASSTSPSSSISTSDKINLDKMCTKSVEPKQIPLKPHRVAPKKPEPPLVPQRDPKTALSTKMNKPNEMEESIYHPIWNFKTVGQVPERYQTDADYYEIDDEGNLSDVNTKALSTAKQQHQSNNADDNDSLASLAISTANDIEEDHGEWETDDEFMFATEILSAKAARTHARNHGIDAISLNSSQANSMQSASPLSGSTVAGFSSSTATLASGISASLSHQLLRNVCIFYSLTETRLRAIIYEYDRVHASLYFAKRQPQPPPQSQLELDAEPPKSDSPCSNVSNESTANDSGIGKSPKAQRSPMPPPRTTSAARVPAKLPPKKFSESGCQPVRPPPPLVSDSVLAWQFMLLDVNYLEDEEDLIVSETEILRAQQIKEDNDTRQNHQLTILQRFKSASFGNLVDLPDEDEKIGISSAIDKMRNKLQRGVFKINNARSPKPEKKNRGIFRPRKEVTSLYMEEGMKPKPIFGAPLEQLELDRTTYYNVPRFVVDCVAYIEQKDCIIQEGLYRASGNKVSIEDLKQKLSESYIYDPKLLVADDIHTLTSLLKQFFRELGAPLIPQDIYERLGRNLNDEAGVESIRDAFEDLPEPNRSTLKFLIKHLTNVAACSSENRMPASNLAIVWGPCILSANQIEFDIGRMNTLAKVLIENYPRIFNESERLVA